jgi:hypothetical protein
MMANFAFTEAKHQIALAGIDLVNDDIRVLLVNNTCTAPSQEDVNTISAITTLGELSGTGYVRKALANQAVNEDNANNRAEFDADDVTWSAINAGTAAAAIVYKHITDDSDAIPLFYIDQPQGAGGFPFVTNGGAFNLIWNAEGIAQLA